MFLPTAASFVTSLLSFLLLEASCSWRESSFTDVTLEICTRVMSDATHLRHWVVAAAALRESRHHHGGPFRLLLLQPLVLLVADCETRRKGRSEPTTFANGEIFAVLQESHHEKM
jgi:hypothetical protein